MCYLHYPEKVSGFLPVRGSERYYRSFRDKFFFRFFPEVILESSKTAEIYCSGIAHRETMLFLAEKAFCAGDIKYIVIWRRLY